MYFKVIIDSGHIGAGKSYEKVCYVKADSIVNLFTMMKNYPGLKSKESGKGIKMVKSVNEQEYEAGKVVEWKREYIKQNQNIYK